MLAFILALAIFVYWSVLGFSLVSALNSRKNLLRNALLSPVVGAAANVLVVIWVNVAGIPLKRASLAVTIILFTGAVLLMVRTRPILPMKRLAPFLVVLILGVFLTGYPLLRFGFDWISFGNDDMANYTLGATYLENYGFFSQPATEKIIQDRDISAILWYYLVARGERPGIEFTNAWAASSAHVNSHEAYMPAMLALHLTLISATGALLLQRRKYRPIALLACLWMAVSSLNTLGTLYQLMAQVFGLALLAGACAMVCTQHRPVTRRLNAGRVVLSSILCAGLLVVYPEILPFFFLTVFLYHFALLVRKQECWKTLLRFTSYVTVGSVAMVNVLAIGIVTETFFRMKNSGLVATPVANILFPFFLIPSGLAHLWGFYAIGKRLSGPFLNLCIVVGAILLLAVCIGALWHAWRGQTVAMMCLIMIAVGLRAFTIGADFALYKLAMYVQPFLLGTAVLSWFHVIERGQKKWRPVRLRKAVLLGPLALLMGAGLTAQVYYTQRSLGRVGGGFVEVPRASDSHLISQLVEMSRKAQPQAVVSDTHNVVLAKIEGNYMMPAPLFFTAEDFVGRFVQIELRPSPYQRLLYRMLPNLGATLRYIYEERGKRFRGVEFDTHGALPSADHFQVRIDTYDSELAHATLLQSLGQNILNRRGIPLTEGSFLRTLDLAQARNQLFYVSSEFGTPFYTKPENRGPGRVSMYQPENDYFYPQATMVSMGRASLLRVLNPSRGFRLALEYTASLNADHENRIPPVSVIGATRQFLDVEGRGSARFFSPPIQPQDIGGGAYFLLDMGTWGFRFPTPRTGLMALYGRDIPLDFRRITGFGRDVSALSEQEYEELAAPEHVQSFPADLANKNLEYSGIYEDAWVAESSYLTLRQGAEGSPLVVRVMVPLVEGKPASSQLILLIDGSVLARRSLTPGECELQIPAAGGGKHRIKLVFDRATNLPAPDNRPVSAKIRFVGFRGR